MTRDQIKAIALARGFTERQQADGSMDLNGYVYAFAEAMYAEGQRVMQERAKEISRIRAWRNLSDAIDRYRYCAPPNATIEAIQQAAEILGLEVKPS